MKATVVLHKNPFNPAQRESLPVRRRRRIRALAPKTSAPHYCVINGMPLMRNAWGRRLRDGDVVAFIYLPEGGDDGSNPLQILAMLAVMAFAPWAVGAMGLQAGTFGAFMAQAAIGLVGSMLVNAIFPPPSLPTPQRMADATAASPTYSLGAQGNSARLGAAIPCQYGRMLSYPDFAADPYLEYAGNEQYLYQLFCLGVGDYDIEAIRIEDTPIANFAEVTTEVIAPGGSLTLFPANVATSVEVAGAELVTSTAVGPYVVNAAGTLANFLSIDLVCPRGLFYANDSGGLDTRSTTVKIEAQQIDDAGVALGAWATLGTPTISAATTTPQRVSYRYAVTAGRYQVRVTRTDAKDTSSRAGHEVDWAGLRAYLPNTADYGNVTLLAVRMRATNNLSNQSSRKINVIATRKLQTWSPAGGWSIGKTATRSIAWAFADACRASYGAKLADSIIPLQSLYDLDAVWTARGDKFDARIDNKMTVGEALSQIARAGRAKWFRQGGQVRIVRDGPQTLPVAMFGMRNTIKGSFSVDYLMPTENTADAVEVTYFDEATWTWTPVVCTLPGSTTDNPAKVKLFGVIQRAHAWREGMYEAACNRYRRKLVKLSTECDGHIPSPVDLVALTHDMPQWGQSGEVVSWNPSARLLTLSEPLVWNASATAFYLGLRRPDGSVSGPWSITRGEADNQVRLLDAAAPDFDLRVDGEMERTQYAFGWGELWRQPAVVSSIRPRGLYRVDLEFVNDDPSVHTADLGVAPAPISYSQLPVVRGRPGAVKGLIARSMQDDITQALLSWQPEPGADGYYVDQSSDGYSWTRCAEPSVPGTSAKALYGPSTQFRVAAYSLSGLGPWISISYSTYAPYFWHADANAFWSAAANPMWSP